MPFRRPWAATLVAAVILPAQEAPAPAVRTVDGTALRYVEQVPPDWTPDRWVPLLVVFPAAEGLEAARAALPAEVAAAGFAIAVPVRGPAAADLGPLFGALRRRFRVEQGGMHALLAGDLDATRAMLRADLHQFQTVSSHDVRKDDGELRVLPARRVRTVPAAGAPLARQLRKLHDERALPGAAGEVARVLDDFHDAAANADAGRYFAILPDDAVFLGTDGTERWTGASFRRELGRWFERPSAWTYVAIRRDVTVEPGGDVAWFDETLDNDGYGECRGSGVLVRRDGRWVLRQYHLAVAVPNDVMHPVAARIRAFHDRRPVATRVVVVRHAEKADDGRDPELSAAGRARAEALAHALADLRLHAVFTSQYRRTAQTVAAVCAAQELAPVAVDAADVAGLAGRIRGDHAGRTVLVCGHSNTVPALLAALGVKDPPTLGDGDYDRMFVLLLDAGEPHLLPLRY